MFENLETSDSYRHAMYLTSDISHYDETDNEVCPIVRTMRYM